MKVPKLYWVILVMIGLFGFMTAATWIFRCEKLTWPEVAAYYESSSPPTSFQFRNADGSFTDYKTSSNLLYISEAGAQLKRENGSIHVLKYKGKTFWTGVVNDITSDKNLVAVTYLAVETSIIDCEKGTVARIPHSLVSLFPGGRVVAQQDPATSVVSVHLIRGDVVQKSFRVDTPSVEDITGLSSNGTSTVVATEGKLTFFGPKRTWTSEPGILHGYRNVKIVSDNSCLTTCWSKSPLMGNDFHLELLSEHNMMKSPQVACDLLIVGEDVNRLRPFLEESRKQ